LALGRSIDGLSRAGERSWATVGLKVDDLSTDRELAEQQWSSLFAVA
jgi:hypothetical protein